MATTTPSTIIDTVETLIEGLTPEGGTSVGINSTFRMVADDIYEGYESNWSDRQFRIFGFENVVVDQMYGTTAQVDYISDLDIVIDHVIGKREASLKRRAEDVHQIIDQLQRYPAFTGFSGVSMIRHTGTEVDEAADHTFWRTTISFEIHYALTSNYGG